MRLTAALLCGVQCLAAAVQAETTPVSPAQELALMDLLRGGPRPIRFANHCFRPNLTGAQADQVLAAPPHRIDFFDLRPASAAAVSPVRAVPATVGTDRRCTVAFNGDYGAVAAFVAELGLERERILTEAPLPDTHADFETPGTTLLAARYLNPNRIAVVHTGTRQGPNGVETFLTVERLTPEATARQN